MKKAENISRDNAEAREGFEKLSPAGKFRHIWHYYKWFILLAVAALIAVITLTRDVGHNLAEERFLNVSLVGGNEAALKMTSVFTGFAEQFGEKESDSVYVDAGLKDNDAASLQILSSRIAGGESDVVAADGESFRQFGERGAFAPLSEVLPEDYLESHREQFVSVKDSLSGEDVACGLAISSGPLVEDHIYAGDGGHVIGICSMAERKDLAAELLMQLLP